MYKFTGIGERERGSRLHGRKEKYDYVICLGSEKYSYFMGWKRYVE